MKPSVLFLPFIVAMLLACSDGSEGVPHVELADNVLIFTEQEIPNYYIQQAIDNGEADPSVRLGGDIMGRAITIVKLRGKTNHFGVDIQQQPPEYIDYHATVPETTVWIAEFPDTRSLSLLTDETGWWTMYVVKDAGVDLEFSFVFEKEGWITTKTNVNTIVDQDNTDFAIQYIDPYYYQYGMLPYVEGMMRSNGYPNFFFENAMVVTVGKSWASMHDDRLPHGDPGAKMTITPDSAEFIGPIYFNESVIPDLLQPDTSLDGGVAWLNMPLNASYQVSARKDGVNYPTVRFHMTDADRDAGVQLYIASPPDSLEGDNDSPPGEP